MQGIDNREHRNLLDVFFKYEQMSIIAKSNVMSDEDFKIQKEMEELSVLYMKFKSLLAELETCGRNYELKKRATRSLIHKRIRILVKKVQEENASLH